MKFVLPRTRENGWDTGYKRGILDTRILVRDTGYGKRDTGNWIWDTGNRIRDNGMRDK